jgi:2',3'-cyclic-nucleotide 2'-phosphodiesterase/3'-nucleotidase
VGLLPHSLEAELDRARMARLGSPIADFLNQVQLEVTGAELSVTSLPNELKGFGQAVTRRDILVNYPYSNTLVVLEVTGETLRQSLERSAAYLDAPLRPRQSPKISPSFLYPKLEHFNFDYIAPLSYCVDLRKPVGQRVSDIRYQGAPVAPDRRFRLCLNSYRAGGAGGYPWYADCKRLSEVNVEMVEILMDYFEKHEQIKLEEYPKVEYRY